METKILHITTARGPAECQLAAGKILGALLTDLRNNGLEAETMDRASGQENGTIRSATVRVKGMNLQKILHTWLGTVQWIHRPAPKLQPGSKSPYRPNHGRKNWFVGIYEVTFPEKLAWKEEELVFQAVRSSGAGGQHVNKVSSAIRAIHPPTGTMVFVQDSRSQLQNKKIARERIAEKLEKFHLQQLIDTVNQKWSQHQELERGNPVRTFTGMEFKPNAYAKACTAAKTLATCGQRRRKKEVKTFRQQRSKLKQELQKEWNDDNK